MVYNILTSPFPPHNIDGINNSIWLDTTTNIYYIKINDIWYIFDHFHSNNGLKGDLGQKGDKGNKGNKGILGFIGDKGSSFLGEKGIFGQKGNKGDIAQNGQKGQKGKQGLTGSKGHNGQKGDKGDFIYSKNYSTFFSQSNGSISIPPNTIKMEITLCGGGGATPLYTSNQSYVIGGTGYISTFTITDVSSSYSYSIGSAGSFKIDDGSGNTIIDIPQAGGDTILYKNNVKLYSSPGGQPGSTSSGGGDGMFGGTAFNYNVNSFVNQGSSIIIPYYNNKIIYNLNSYVQDINGHDHHLFDTNGGVGGGYVSYSGFIFIIFYY